MFAPAPSHLALAFAPLQVIRHSVLRQVMRALSAQAAWDSPLAATAAATMPQTYDRR